MRKKILSMSIAAVLTAVTSSSVMAFDTTTVTGANSAFDGTILVQGTTTPAGYTGNILPITGTANPNPPVLAAAPLALSANGRGDALIFPVFSQCQSATDPLCVVNGVASNWKSEVVIRNTSRTNAIVAKVSFYESINSTEVLDFNIYLSADDVTRFTISNGTVTSTDDSIIRLIPSTIGGSGSDDVERRNFASVANPFSVSLANNAGYIVVYGMAEANTAFSIGNDNDARYHTQHDLLFENYRRELDSCRPNWRVGTENAMLNGTYTQGTQAAPFSIAAPNQGVACGGRFGDVNPVLTGTIRLESDVPANLARDMMLPAVAINNFTAGNKLLWTEGEIAALQDRRIQGVAVPVPVAIPPGPAVAAPWAKYNEAGVIADAAAFLVGTTTYIYKKKSVDNQLIVTQPYKRVLVQLGNDNGYWSGVGTGAPVRPFGGFSFFSKFFDEFEEESTITVRTSPSSSSPRLNEREVHGLSNFENLAGNKLSGEAFADDNGFALVRFTNAGGGVTTPTGTTYRIPAIITQMVGTTVGGAPQLNWIYSQTN